MMDFEPKSPAAGFPSIHDKNLKQRCFPICWFYIGTAPRAIWFYWAAPLAFPRFGFWLDGYSAEILGGQRKQYSYISFPKNNSGRDVMVDAHQLAINPSG
jgi:hypothetical protein